MDRTRGLRNRKPEQIQSEMEDLFRTLFNGQRTLHHRVTGGWRPHAEVYETRDALVVRVELAGIDEAALDISVEDRLLQIRGVRRHDVGDERRVYHQLGIAYGPFSAEVFLPFAIEPERVEAVYEGGMLEVTLPKVPPRRVVPRMVRVGSAHGAGADADEATPASVTAKAASGEERA